MIRFLTAGESHGPALVGIVEGVPAGLSLVPDDLNRHLSRRQQGYGRGNRMKIESDTAVILSGVRFGKTIGSPIAFTIENRDWKNWTEKMNQFEDHSSEVPPISIPRPGHADATGKLKYGFDDIRPVIDRSSARETATRVACGAIAKVFLKSLGIEVGSFIRTIGHCTEPETLDAKRNALLQTGADALSAAADASHVRVLDSAFEQTIIAHIDAAKAAGDTLGGIFEVVVTGLPVGLGSYAQFDRKLDAQLAAAIVSIQAVKGVEIGTAFRNAVSLGSEVHDAMRLTNGSLTRPTNNAGGIEGGMTNGEPLIIRGAMKPISTLMSPLGSFDFETLENTEARIERSDVCATPACSVIAEMAVAPVIANAVLEKLGGDSVAEIQERITRHREQIAKQFQK
jgi:chorismate synthase